MFILCFPQAEESYMADEENQGNTLVSVAPLNQPEPQEKPSLNGESQEAVKAQTPPAATNGHSTTKTADTELWTSQPATKRLWNAQSLLLKPSSIYCIDLGHKAQGRQRLKFPLQNTKCSI